MKNFHIDPLSGNIFFNNLCVLPLNEKEFISIAHSIFRKVKKYPSDDDLIVYSNDKAVYGAYSFEAHVRFGNGILDRFSLDWLGGITEQKGWDSSNSDLIRDKSSLTRFIEKIAEKKPNQHEEYEDTFIFEWGCIKSVGIRREMYAKIDITWKRSN